MGTTISSSLSRHIYQERLTIFNNAAFVYAPGETGTRYCCERWDDLVRRPSTRGKNTRRMVVANQKRY